MRLLFILSFICCFNNYANDYETLLEKFESRTTLMKRKKIINDDFLCTQYFPEEDSIKIKSVLRLKKSGKRNVKISFKRTPWHNNKLSLIDKKTFAYPGFELRRIKSGKLIIKTDESILYCKYPMRRDDWIFNL